MAKYFQKTLVKPVNRVWPQKRINAAPIWCSVDLRDGNQALAQPMSIGKKLKMFELLVQLGFKEIEVGFPSASQIDFDFLRLLIDEKRIPDEITIQILTQSRKHLIDRSFEALAGVKKAIIHLYNSTSPVQRKVTFNMSKQEIKDLAVRGTVMIREGLPALPDTEIRFEYSPESFSDTETDYALEVCEAVMEAWGQDRDDKIILNLPATVENDTPNVYADMVEWFCQNLPHRERALISLHTHNDRGTGIAAAELGLLAGADRVEGTLFGNGERTGNTDLITMALNIFSQGVNPQLKLDNIPEIRRVYEDCTQMAVPPRHPYAGDLVFTAFSGSHQDAIKKGLDRRDDKTRPDAAWEVPYLLIDPKDIGRNYEAIIRINSQSGKGGVAYILKEKYGYDIPTAMRPELGRIVNTIADEQGMELSEDQVFDIFKTRYLNLKQPLQLLTYQVNHQGEKGIILTAEIKLSGQQQTISGVGNGVIDALVHAIKENRIADFTLLDFHEHALNRGSDSEAASYILIEDQQSTQQFWGAGRDCDISRAGIFALLSCINKILV